MDDEMLLELAKDLGKTTFPLLSLKYFTEKGATGKRLALEEVWELTFALNAYLEKLTSITVPYMDEDDIAASYNIVKTRISAINAAVTEFISYGTDQSLQNLIHAAQCSSAEELMHGDLMSKTSEIYALIHMIIRDDDDGRIIQGNSPVTTPGDVSGGMK